MSQLLPGTHHDLIRDVLSPILVIALVTSAKLSKTGREGHMSRRKRTCFGLVHSLRPERRAKMIVTGNRSLLTSLRAATPSTRSLGQTAARHVAVPKAHVMQRTIDRPLQSKPALVRDEVIQTG